MYVPSRYVIYQTRSHLSDFSDKGTGNFSKNIDFRLSSYSKIKFKIRATRFRRSTYQSLFFLTEGIIYILVQSHTSTFMYLVQVSLYSYNFQIQIKELKHKRQNPIWNYIQLYVVMYQNIFIQLSPFKYIFSGPTVFDS